MKEAEADGEPVTKEEAEEMARMELGKRLKDAMNTAKSRKRKPRERKVDKEKSSYLIVLLQDCVQQLTHSTS